MPIRWSLFLIPLAWCAGEAATHVSYVGGTLDGLKPGQEVSIDFGSRDMAGFSVARRQWSVPYRNINQIEYGQKISRNVAAAIVISPLFLLTKKRAHFVTVGYADPDGTQQAIVVRVGKADIRALLASLEARTGLRVTFLDDESRKM